MSDYKIADVKERLARKLLETAFAEYKAGHLDRYETLKSYMYPGELDELQALVEEYDSKFKEA
jgi:hypothetical protein